MTSLKIHPAAFDELIAAGQFYQAKRTGLGEDFLEQIQSGFYSIQERPEMWPEFIPGFRRLILKRFPFAIIYQLKEDYIEIIGIMHLNRQPGYWLDRTGG